MALYRALYDYLPDDDSSSFMPLRINDRIDKVKDIGNGWFMGFNKTNGDFGIFPASYVEKIETVHVKSDIAGRLMLLPDKPTDPPSDMVIDEICRLKDAVDNDQMLNVQAGSTIRIEPSPATEIEDATIEKIDMTALKAEINRQLMLKQTISEEKPNKENVVDEQQLSVVETISDTVENRPYISHPKPIISDEKPKITHPKPLITHPKPVTPKPKRKNPPSISLPMQPEVSISQQQGFIDLPPLMPEQEPLKSDPKPTISSPIPLEPTKPDPTPPKPIISHPIPLETTNPDPTPPKPMISHPIPLEPTNPDPTPPKPIISHPIHLEPTKPDPTVPKPIISHPIPLEPTKPDPTPPKPIISHPIPLEPTKPYPTLSKPIISHPIPLEPINPDPAPPKPIISHHIPLEPTNPDPTPPKPIISHPIPLEPTKPDPSPPKPIISHPVPLQPLQDDDPIPSPRHHIPMDPIKIESIHPKPEISVPVLLEPIENKYPAALQPIIHKNEEIPDSPKSTRDTFPQQPIETFHQPSPTPKQPNTIHHHQPTPIQPNKRLIISEPVLQETIDNNYPVPLRPIEEYPLKPQPIVHTSPILSEAVKTPTNIPKFIDLTPIAVEDHDHDPTKPVISNPIPIDNTMPPPQKTSHDPGLPVVVMIPSYDTTEFTDVDTNPEEVPSVKKKQKGQKREKKQKEKKEKFPKEKKPPFDFRLWFYGNIAHCMEKNPLKTILLGILGGIISGAIVFILLAFSFRYDYDVAGWITLGVTLVFSVFLALSATFRCLVLLMVPTLFTGRGRSFILAAIFAIMLAGPVVNISDNASKVSETMACTSELIHNQTEALKHQLLAPLIKIARRINESFSDLKKFADSIQKLIDPVVNFIEQFQSKAQEAFDKLKEAAAQCKSKLNGIHQDCKNKINDLKSDCEDFLNKIDPTSEIIDVAEDIVTGIGKIFGIGKRKRRGILSQNHTQFVQAILGYNFTDNDIQYNAWMDRATSVGPSCELTKYGPEIFYPQPFNNSCRVRRGLLSTACVIFNADILCAILNVASFLCSPVDFLADLASDVLKEVKDILFTLTNFFVFGLESNFDLAGGINASKSSAQIVADVKADIAQKTEVVLYVTKIITQVLACSLIFLLLKSFFYLNKYRTKDHFDNIYITKEFRKYDGKREAMGRKHVLPLQSRERRKYVITNSILLAPVELKACKAGWQVVSRSLLISMLIIAADYGLYYILVLIEKYGRIDINVSGTSTVTLDIQGKSPLAILVRYLASSVQVDYDYSIDFNMTVCLPNPSEPSTANIFLIAFLYFLALVFMFLQAYGLRLRRKIAASYYPEVEFDRIQYLHAKIRVKRRTLLGWMGHLLRSRKKEQEISDRLTLSSWCYYSCPFLASIFDCKPTKTICLNCSRESDGLMKFHICQTKNCDGLYCAPCYKEMDETCQICKKKKVPSILMEL